jgi:hypothetical protein
MSQTMSGPDPASTATQAMPPRAAREEENRAFADTPPTEGATPAPKTAEPPSPGGRSETTEAAPTAPAATSTSTTLGASSAMPVAPASERVANPMERAARQPHPVGETASQGAGPSRASLPPLPEILGRPLRIIADPHANTDEAWARAREAMIATL